MYYRQFRGDALSALGLGAMRLPILDGDDGQVDQTAVNAMVDAALVGGVNYFDTAWGYHRGNSERAMGRALARHPRESYFLADKFPGYDKRSFKRIEAIFAEQLERCGVEYFDYYLLHNVCELNLERYLDESNGLMEFLLAQKAAGRIRHLGFSSHAALPALKKFLERRGKAMEFCQLQLNYLDWDFQDAKGKVELLRSFELPTWVMEPLRGGRLCRLGPEESAALAELRPQETQPGWAFHFLQGVEGVTVVLSGMSNEEQLKENMELFASPAPLTDDEQQTLLNIAGKMTGGVPCTACRYCTEHCPQKLDIPRLIELYNEHRFTGGGFIAPFALKAMGKEKQPANCIACRSCEAVCPQQLKISEIMSDFAGILE